MLVRFARHSIDSEGKQNVAR
ncbi:protein of unknown function [Burkholderia multivorans]